MKKIFLYVVGLLLIAGVAFAWLLFGPGTGFNGDKKYLYVRPGNDMQQQVQAQVDTANLFSFPAIFKLAANNAGVWDKLRAGRFEIKKGASIVTVVRMLRNNTQSPVKLVINKLRTKENFARQLGKNFSFDSAAAMNFLSSNDSLLALGVDTNTVFTLLIQNTYFFNWYTQPLTVLERLKEEHQKFWNETRLQQAQEQGLTPEQVYTIASIIDEETNKQEDKGKIASVYINRMNKGMLLGADPTVKYALRDFALKRIYYKHLAVESPYNTYKYKGLPPGPICIAATSTIDAVLQAPKTDYLFFVANSDFSGYHHFSNSFAEHDKYAKEYQRALDDLIRSKQTQ
ncbi:endolytic transglycosylase MltG [Panacibacter sp. DH6]|uniref:Endolytic murein transglycosylase n=1 Tax=Panacibacter microcysteis TaxID=2793269 RepID=A0A931EB54_9BACT|nr:endolytic transglycosylase MltG [Panacibacter microcysteis]MBG9377784.1 endolytic transglycosylase MltG [Panacibacter microcysteis]